MKALSVVRILILFALAVVPGLSQNSELRQTEGDWVSRFELYPMPLVIRPDRYSDADLNRFREKVEAIYNSKPQSEWEGVYTSDIVELGISQLRVNFRKGFVDFYVYSCFPELRSLKYGSVIDSLDTIQFIPEYSEDSPNKRPPETYVKVRWGSRNYLVEESSLEAFAKKAAGIYVETSENDSKEWAKWSDYWVMGDTENSPKGLPEFPKRYKHLEKRPITAKITTVGTRSIEEEIDMPTGEHFNEVAVYRVVINAGTKQGLVKGMIFSVLDTRDKVFITSITNTKAEGMVVRLLDDDKVDSCTSEEYEPAACKPLTPNMSIKTEIGQFHW
jgi:hypothetical protein